MKFTTTFATASLATLVVANSHAHVERSPAHAHLIQRDPQFGRARFGGKGQGGRGGGGQNQGADATAATAATTAAAATGGAAASGAGAAAGAGGDPQTSLTLDPSQVQPGLALDGQQIPAANQVASATSTNNFINFCLTRSDLPLTNGAQVKTGSCNNVPLGVIAAQANMPSSKFTFPKNMDNIAASTTFTITMAIKNLVTGNFVNAQANYFSAPQNTDASGTIIGHSHVVIEAIDSLASTTVTNPTQFAFFKGFNVAAVNGILSADVAGGLPAGTYKMSSINSASNHQPVLVAVAQHGSLDDAVYFTVGGAGAVAAAGGAGAAAGGAGGAAQAGGAGAANAGNNAGGGQGQGQGKGQGTGAFGGRGGNNQAPGALNVVTTSTVTAQGCAATSLLRKRLASLDELN